MITQKIKQGTNEIKIESAENLEDAKKNNFSEGEYSRYFINGKPVPNYMVLIKYLVEETHKNKESFIPDNKSLMQQRNTMLKSQNNEMKKQLKELKKQYGSHGLDESVLIHIDSMIPKINDEGVRVIE